MSAALFNALANPKKARGIAAGTEPASHVHPVVVDVMREIGIDVSAAKPQLLSDGLARSAYMLVTMGCGEQCPTVPGLRRDDWQIKDPKGLSVEQAREVREEIRQRVAKLIAEEGL